MPEEALRHVDWVAEESAEEPDGTQLQGVAQKVVITAARGDGVEIGVIEVEEARQLLRRRFTAEAPIALGLFVGKKVNRHPSMLRDPLANVLGQSWRNARSSPEGRCRGGVEVGPTGAIDQRSAETMESIRESGSQFQSISEPWADSTSPDGKMIMTIFAEFEGDLIQERCRADGGEEQGSAVSAPA